MIGAFARVLGYAPAKLAKSHDQHSVKNAFCFEVAAESSDSFCQLVQQPVMRSDLALMGVVPSLAGVVDSCRQAASNQPANE